MKVVINCEYGGFALSQTALDKLPKDEDYYYNNRSDPLLVRVVEELGEQASGRLSVLEIVEWPDSVPYKLSDYDGIEKVEIDIYSLIQSNLNELRGSGLQTSKSLMDYWSYCVQNK